MSDSKPTSKIMFGLTIWVALMPLAFMFSQDGTQLLLLETSFRVLVWSFQIILLLLLFFTGNTQSKKQLMGLSVLCLLIPFVFTFNENGVSFLILNQYASSILSWVIASTLFGKLMLPQYLKEKIST